MSPRHDAPSLASPRYTSLTRATPEACELWGCQLHGWHQSGLKSTILDVVERSSCSRAVNVHIQPIAISGHDLARHIEDTDQLEF